MGEPLTFRVLVCEPSGSRQPVTGVQEGPALAAAVSELDRHRACAGTADEFPAKNRHGSRRWRLFDAAGAQVGELYVEPDHDAAVTAPGWLASGGYPFEGGWWLQNLAGVSRVR